MRDILIGILGCLFLAIGGYQILSGFFFLFKEIIMVIVRKIQREVQKRRTDNE